MSDNRIHTLESAIAHKELLKSLRPNGKAASTPIRTVEDFETQGDHDVEVFDSEVLNLASVVDIWQDAGVAHPAEHENVRQVYRLNLSNGYIIIRALFSGNSAAYSATRYTAIKRATYDRAVRLGKANRVWSEIGGPTYLKASLFAAVWYIAGDETRFLKWNNKEARFESVNTDVAAMLTALIRADHKWEYVD